MKIEETVRNVFKKEGFFSNYTPGGDVYQRVSIISKTNLFKLLKKANLTEVHFYDKEKIHFLLDAKIDPFEDKDVVLNEFDGKIYEKEEDLISFLNKNKGFKYVEYAK